MKRNHMSNVSHYVTPIFTFTFALISIVNCQTVSATTRDSLDGLNINVLSHQVQSYTSTAAPSGRSFMLTLLTVALWLLSQFNKSWFHPRHCLAKTS